MTINYTTVLKGKLGIAYDIMFQGQHLNFTILKGIIVECVTIANGSHVDTGIETQADLCQYIMNR